MEGLVFVTCGAERMLMVVKRLLFFYLFSYILVVCDQLSPTRKMYLCLVLLGISRGRQKKCCQGWYCACHKIFMRNGR